MKRRVFDILSIDEGEDRISRAVDTALLLLILSTVASLVIVTDERIHSMSPGFFYYFELVAFSIFAFEYIIRLWSCTENPKHAHPVTGRMRYAMQPLMIADAVAVLSYFILLALPSGMDLGALRALRLVSRFALLARYSSGLQALSAAVSARRNELLAVVSVVGALLVLASSLMYYIEQSAQPEKFSSIPVTMWWGIITVTTVGYGDVAPITPGGRLLAGVIALLGIGIFALPAGILGSGFMEQVNRRRAPVTTHCPRCGFDLVGRPNQDPEPP